MEQSKKMDITTSPADFEQLIMEHYNELFKYVFNQFEQVELTKDITQDIWVKLYEKRQYYNPKKSSFRTWMYRVAHHHCVNVRRSYYKNRPIVADLSVLSSDEDILEAMIQHEEVQMILDVMDRVLNKKHKQIMNLHFFGQCSLEEISVITKVAKKTVSNVITISIRKIRDEIGVNQNA